MTVALVGLFVGIFIGISGAGGSSLMRPLLIILPRIHPAPAIGTDLVYSASTKLGGALVRGRQRTVDKRLVVTLAAGGIRAALVGLAVAAAPAARCARGVEARRSENGCKMNVRVGGFRCASR